MRVVLLGAGRVSTHLQKALVKAGHEVCAVWSPTRGTTHDISTLPTDADVYVIAVKDDALQEVISQVVKGREDRLFLHTAGSMPLAIFQGYCHRYGVFYPMQTFSMDREVDFAEIPLFVEGDDPLIRPLAESISRHVYDLSTEDRKYLHLAAVFACNFTNHCYALAAQVLAKKGLPFSVMLPLVDETARKVHELHPVDAQTGPAVRHDQQVMAMQQSLLESPLHRELYRLLSESIHQQATDYDTLRLTEDTRHRV